MPRERIQIRNFCGIKELDIDLAQITILIGPQAVGKSLCAKVVYFFKRLIANSFDSATRMLSFQEFEKASIHWFSRYFPNLGRSDFSLAYSFSDPDSPQDDLSITIVGWGGKEQKLNITYSLKISEYFEKARQLADLEIRPGQALSDPQGPIARQLEFFSQTFTRGNDRRLTFAPVFVSVERWLLAHADENYFGLLAPGRSIDVYLEDFRPFFSRMKSHHGSRFGVFSEDHRNLSGPYRLMDQLLQTVLKSKHHRSGALDFLYHPDDRDVPISMASSGQQEFFPLDVMLRGIPFDLERAGVVFAPGYSLCIEEPEAHLYPKSQQATVECLAILANMFPDRSQFLITTHSPYILTAFNNLIEAGEVAAKLPEGELPKLWEIVAKEKILTADRVKAYELTEEGATLINDSETRLIGASKIDRVSDEIGGDFERLLDLEYGS